MATASESSTNQTVSLPVLDLRFLSRSELHTLSLSDSTGLHRRSDDDNFTPKIDRSVFKESAGSRKQTFTRLRLASRNDKQKSVVRASSSASAKIPLHIPESVERENSQIIGHLQNLFGVEALRAANNNGLVPLQIASKQPSQENADSNVSMDVDVPNGCEKKRKREQSSGTRVGNVAGNGKAVETGKKKKDVEDPFGEELIKRTEGFTTESELFEFLEGLHGEWGSKLKKRRIVDASELCDLLPAGWKVVINLQKRAGRASVVCRRYLSPDGGQYDSYKETVSHITECKMVDGYASSHQEKQASITTSSSIGIEKLDTSDGSFHCDLAYECNLGVTTTGASEESDPQTEDKQSSKVNNNEVQGCSSTEDISKLHFQTCLQKLPQYGNV